MINDEISKIENLLDLSATLFAILTSNSLFLWNYREFVGDALIYMFNLISNYIYFNPVIMF